MPQDAVGGFVLLTASFGHRYGDVGMPIVSFRSQPLEQLFTVGTTRRIDRRLHKKLVLMLDVLNRAEALSDVASLSGFHPLSGALRGRYAVTVTGNWRVIFRMEGADIHDVDYRDYH
jgi:proteic killer suppression protein